MVVPQFPVGTFASSIERRCVKKRQVLDVIDIGCADGNFYLNHYALRLLSGSSAVNIDAKPVIEAGFGLFDLAGRQWSDPRLILACLSQPQACSSRKPSGTRLTPRRSSRSKSIDASNSGIERSDARPPAGPSAAKKNDKVPGAVSVFMRLGCSLLPVWAVFRQFQ
jgi:hypothetical protein